MLGGGFLEQPLFNTLQGFNLPSITFRYKFHLTELVVRCYFSCRMFSSISSDLVLTSDKVSLPCVSFSAALAAALSRESRLRSLLVLLSFFLFSRTLAITFLAAVDNISGTWRKICWASAHFLRWSIAGLEQVQGFIHPLIPIWDRIDWRPCRLFREV